jgi:hypothetical protein
METANAVGKGLYMDGPAVAKMCNSDGSTAATAATASSSGGEGGWSTVSSRRPRDPSKKEQATAPKTLVGHGNNVHGEAMRKARVARLAVKGGALGEMATGGQGHSARVIGLGDTDKTKVE